MARKRYVVLFSGPDVDRQLGVHPAEGRWAGQMVCKTPPEMLTQVGLRGTSDYKDERFAMTHCLNEALIIRSYWQRVYPFCTYNIAEINIREDLDLG